MYERALTIREKRLGPEHVDVANVLHNFANLNLRMGNFVEARQLYQRSLAIRRKTLGPRHIDVALTYVTMGVMYQMMGDYGEAREVLVEAIAICRDGDDTHALLLSGALNNLGNVHWSLGEPEKARNAYREALDIKTRRLGPDHPDLVQELNNLAEASTALKDYDAAIALYERAIKIGETKLGPDHYNLSPPLNNLANVLVLKERYAQAKPLYERALAIRRARLGPLHPDVAETIMNLSGLALAEGKRPEALALAIEASDLALAKIRDTLRYLPESAALDLASTQEEAHAILFEGLRTAKDDAPDWLSACWDWALKRKGIVLEEMAARHRSVLQAEGAEARSVRDDLAGARGALAALWAEGLNGREPAAYDAALKEAIDRKESAEERLAALSVRFRDERARRDAGLAAVRAALRPGETLVEIARVEVGLPVIDDRPARDIALILSHDGAAWADLGPAVVTDRLVGAWRAELTAGFAQREDPAAAGRLDLAGKNLRRAVWDPIAPHLAGSRLVLLVPDGSLHQVDFGALPTDAGHFVIEETPPMQLLGTGRDVVARTASVPPASPPISKETPRGLLALGAPDFAARVLARANGDGMPMRSAPSRCAAVHETIWSPLPEAEREIAAIADLMKEREPVTILSGAQAIEEALLRDAPQRRFLHIATHGFFLGSCGGALENPLLHSGLVLAGANATTGAGDPGISDGILTAEEIVATDLRGVDLAVLSACDTGRGEVAVGEGVFGLRRALEIAGVRTVVMSLWPVPDRQARRWMIDFYRASIIDGSSARDAARHASLTLLADLRAKSLPVHPYLWTGFVVAGAAD